MADSGVVSVPLEVEIQRLTWMGEKDRISILAQRLHGYDGEVIFGDGVGNCLLWCGIETVHLPPQHRSFERTTGLARLERSKSVRQKGVAQQGLIGVTSIILMGEMTGNAAPRR